MAVDAPCHRQILSLIYLIHLIDASVASDAADAAAYVDGMVEINEIGQAMDASPRNGVARFPALMQSFELVAGWMHGRQRWLSGRFFQRAVAVDTR